MRLLIDIGNTRLKWATLNGDKLGEQRALIYEQELLSDQLDQEWSLLPVPSRIFISSVASKQCTKAIIDWAVKQWGCPVEQLQSTDQCAGVVNGYRTPEQLGIDRWAAIVAAYGIVGSAVCVVDCGTALTCDGIDGDGNHIGGVIVPGQAVMRAALLEGTAGVYLREMPRLDTPWGRDTASCVAAGGIQSAVGLVERMVRQMQCKLDESIMVILTGGDAKELIPLLTLPYRYEADLVLQGIARIVTERLD